MPVIGSSNPSEYETWQVSGCHGTAVKGHQAFEGQTVRAGRGAGGGLTFSVDNRWSKWIISVQAQYGSYRNPPDK